MPKIQAYRNLKKISDPIRAKNNQWSYKRPQDSRVQHASSLLLEGVTFKHPSGVAFEEYYSGTSTHYAYKYKSVFAKVQGTKITVDPKEKAWRMYATQYKWVRLGCNFSPQKDRYFTVSGVRINRAKAVLLDENRKAWVAV